MSLGSIIVRLTMNTADFVTDAGRAAKIAERRAKEIDAAFSKAGRAIGAALGVGLAGATVAIKSSIDRMDELSKSAQKVRLPTDDFSRLAHAGELADVSMETLVGSLGKLTKAQAAALSATSEQAKVFAALDIAATNADGSLRPVSEVIGEFADRFRALDGSPEAMAAGFALFGRSFQDLIPLLSGGSEGLREASAEADRLGITLSTDAGQAAEQFNDNITRLQRALGGVGVEIASGMLPQLNAMTGELVAAAGETDDLRSFGEGLGTVLKGLGSGFAFVAGMTRQFTIDTLALSDALAGYLETARNIATLGLASGTVSGGLNRASNAFQTRRELTQGDRRARANAEAQANIDRLLANGVQYNGPLLDDGARNADAAAANAKRQAALRLALSGGGSARTARATGGKSDAEKQAEDAARAAREAADAQARWHGTILDMEATLSGPMAEANREYERNIAQLNEDFNQGNVALADYARGLEAYAAERDKEIAAINARMTPAQEMLADMQFELELLGKTREEQELLTAARYLGAEAATAQGKAALAAMREAQEASKLVGDQIAVMDQFRDSTSDALFDFATGAKTAEEDLKDFFKTMADMILRMIAEKWIEQLFGAQGSTGSDTGGGNFLGSLVSGFLGLFGGSQSSGGFASGGYTGAGGVNEPAGIVHRGEVVWSQGDIARSGGVAAVESMRRGGGSRVSGESKRPLVVFNESQMLDALAAHGGLEKVVVHYMERNRDRLRAAV